MSQSVVIFGKKFAALRGERYLTQDEFAHRLEMSPANVRRLEQSESSGMQVKSFRRLATMLNMSPAELRQRIGVPATAAAPVNPSAARTAGPTHDASFPRALQVGSQTDVMEVDHFHGVSAARAEQRTAIERGKVLVPAGSPRQFSCQVDGDCMEPRYCHNDIVVFSVDEAEREGIVDGKNYFIQFADGENTFKRIFTDPENRELLVLKCWNENYPPRVIERAAITLLARAIYKLSPDV